MRSSVRAALTWGLLCVLSGLTAPASAFAAPTPELQASMQCDRANEPGRVRCAIEAHSSGGNIAWADVAIVGLPEFAAALKGRIGPSDATAREPGTAKWALALVAKKTGQGEVRARVRAVVCEAHPSGAKCGPVVAEVHALLSVGG